MSDRNASAKVAGTRWAEKNTRRIGFENVRAAAHVNVLPPTGPAPANLRLC